MRAVRANATPNLAAIIRNAFAYGSPRLVVDQTNHSATSSTNDMTPTCNGICVGVTVVAALGEHWASSSLIFLSLFSLKLCGARVLIPPRPPRPLLPVAMSLSLYLSISLVSWCRRYTSVWIDYARRRTRSPVIATGDTRYSSYSSMQFF